MSQLIHARIHPNTTHQNPDQPSRVQRLTAWLSDRILRYWQAQCRHAERSGRFVPRY